MAQQSPSFAGQPQLKQPRDSTGFHRIAGRSRGDLVKSCGFEASNKTQDKNLVKERSFAE
jgi:hypothetical protein